MRAVYTGFKAAPFREVPNDEPIGDLYQLVVNRSEERVRQNQRPEAAPLLAARQAERLQFAETVADIEPNDDDDLWQQPDKASPIALFVCCTSALLVVAALGTAVAQMVRG